MTDYQRIEKVIKYLIEHQESQPDLDVLAKQAGLSKFHFHRLFTRWAGVTPKEFLQFITSLRAKSLLRKRDNVLNVSYEVGLSGPGRLHDLLITLDGMTPGEFKAKGAGIEIRYGIHETLFGKSLIGVTEKGICFWHILVGEHDLSSALKELHESFPQAKTIRDQSRTKKIVAQVFNSKPGKQKVKLFAVGTPFQLKVWEALLKIPSGKVSSYGSIAKAINTPKACRAVGTAVGSNPISFLIPCHRVIRETGVIGQYRWGPSRKHAMLFLENTSAFQKTRSK